MSVDGMDVNQLMNQTALRNLGITWLQDPDQVERVNALKNMVLGNCRLLYGSERFKFYDIVIAEDESSEAFCAILVCSQDLASKILRKEISNCPVKAVVAMVDRLQKDTALLLTKFDVGSQLRGQQGFMNEMSHKWELAKWQEDDRREGCVDDTKSLNIRYDAPRGPRGDRLSFKRSRVDSGLPYDD